MRNVSVILKNKIELYGIIFDFDSPNLRINRDNYAIIDKKNHEVSATLRRNACMKKFLESDIEKVQNVGKNYFDNLHRIYEDDSFEIFIDEYCIAHQQDCLYNYDLNMKLFEKISYDEFSKVVNKILKKFKKLYEISDLTRGGERGTDEISMKLDTMANRNKRKLT